MLTVFPGGHLPTLEGLVGGVAAGSEGRLVIDSVSNIGPHYARTLREWNRRFVSSFDTTIAPGMPKFFRRIQETDQLVREQR